MPFPRKPLFDKIIVRETPIEETFEQGEIEIPLDDVRVKLRNREGVVVAVGDCVPMQGFTLPMPVEVGDTVYFEDTAMYEQVFSKAADEFRSGLPKYWQIRVHDLKGVAVKAHTPKKPVISAQPVGGVQ
jgi:co-chaperonin GroES (HSP10)